MTKNSPSARFRIRLEDGSELPIASAESLARRIAQGDVRPHTALFDAGTGEWNPAGDVAVVRFIVEEVGLEQGAPLPGWSGRPERVASAVADAAPGVPELSGEDLPDFGLTPEGSGADRSEEVTLPDPPREGWKHPADDVPASVAPASPGGLLKLDVKRPDIANAPSMAAPTPKKVAAAPAKEVSAVPAQEASAAPAKPTPTPSEAPVTDGTVPLGTGTYTTAAPAANARARSSPVPETIVRSIGTRPADPTSGKGTRPATKRRHKVLSVGLVGAGVIAGAVVLGGLGRASEEPEAQLPSTTRPIAREVAALEAIPVPSTYRAEPLAPPVQAPRPTVPAVPQPLLDEGLTIAPTITADEPLDALALPPPPSREPLEISNQPAVTPFDVAPQVRNLSRVQQVLNREYPPLLRDAGIGGTVQVRFFVTEDGTVERYQVQESSGNEQLDAAALRVADVFQFSPALYRGRPVAVELSLEVTFDAGR